MTRQDPPQEAPLVHWWAIAAAVGRAIGASVCVRTAQRYAKAGRRNRLPVDHYDNGVVYLLPSALKLWVKARKMPIGGRPPGATPTPSKGGRRRLV